MLWELASWSRLSADVAAAGCFSPRWAIVSCNACCDCGRPVLRSCCRNATTRTLGECGSDGGCLTPMSVAAAWMAHNRVLHMAGGDVVRASAARRSSEDADVSRRCESDRAVSGGGVLAECLALFLCCSMGASASAVIVAPPPAARASAQCASAAAASGSGQRIVACALLYSRWVFGSNKRRRQVSSDSEH